MAQMINHVDYDDLMIELFGNMPAMADVMDTLQLVMDKDNNDPKRRCSMIEYVVFVDNAKVFLIKEDEHFTQKLKERIYRYDEQMKGER